MPTYPRYDLLLTLDPTLWNEISDYDGFRERWLAAGGQRLLDEAEASSATSD